MNITKRWVGVEEKFTAEKLVTRLLVEGCYGAERAFIWPKRIRHVCACTAHWHYLLLSKVMLTQFN